jgi:hypothetical protein
MFSIFLLFLATLLLSSASVFSQQKNQKIISIDFKEYSLTRALHEINRLSGQFPGGSCHERVEKDYLETG